MRIGLRPKPPEVGRTKTCARHLPHGPPAQNVIGFPHSRRRPRQGRRPCVGAQAHGRIRMALAQVGAGRGPVYRAGSQKTADLFICWDSRRVCLIGGVSADKFARRPVSGPGEIPIPHNRNPVRRHRRFSPLGASGSACELLPLRKFEYPIVSPMPGGCHVRCCRMSVPSQSG